MKPSKKSSPESEPLSAESGKTDQGWFARPLVPLAAALIAGIWWAATSSGRELAALCLVAAVSAPLAILAARSRPRAVRLCAVLVFFLIGEISFNPSREHEFAGNHVARLADGSFTRLTGVVSGRVENRPENTRFVLDAETVEKDGRIYSVTGKVTVTARDLRTALGPFDRVAFFTRLRRVTSFKNPGSFDYASFMAEKDIFASAFLDKRSAPVVFRDDPGSADTWDLMRRSIADSVNRAAPGEGGLVLSALLTGQASGIPKDLKQAFADAGVSHLLAVSGLHVGLAAGFAFFVINGLLGLFPVLALTGRARRAAFLLAIIPAVSYGLLTGMSPSTQRAVIMVGIFFLSFSVKRQSDSINTLAAAALAILAFRPESLFNISFQLSFLSVLFILIGFRAIPFLRNSPEAGGRLKLWLHRLASLFAMTVFATLATFPIVLRSFHQVSLAGFGANFVLVPLVGSAGLPVGLAGAAVLPVWPEAASLLFSLSGFFMEWGVGVIRRLAGLPFSAVMPVLPSVFEAVLYYLLFLCVMGLRKSAAARVGLAVVILALALDGCWWYRARFLDESLRITVLDVGQGAGMVVRFPRGPVMIIDAGGLAGESSLDVGKAVVAPYLWSQKIHTVDVAVLSHPDQDHAGGMPFILERFNVRKFWSTGQGTDSQTYRKIAGILKERGIARKSHRELWNGTEINGVSVKSLYPPPDVTPPEGKQTNRFSLVLKLAMGEKAVIIPGDVTKPALKEMMKTTGPGELDATVLVVPHHGAKSSFLQEFADAVRPRWAVVSAGLYNQWGLPRADVLNAYRKAGAEILRTDRDGAVFIETDGRATSVSTFAGLRP